MGATVINRKRIADVGKIEQALGFIPAYDRDVWVKIGMAIKADLRDSGFDIWGHCSQTADNYRGRDTRDVWRVYWNPVLSCPPARLEPDARTRDTPAFKKQNLAAGGVFGCLGREELSLELNRPSKKSRVFYPEMCWQQLWMDS